MRRPSQNDRINGVDVAEQRSVRSFSSMAEALQLDSVPKEDPNEEAARAEYLRVPTFQGVLQQTSVGASPLSHATKSFDQPLLEMPGHGRLCDVQLALCLSPTRLPTPCQ